MPDRFINDHLVEMFPLFDQARLQLVDVTNLAAVRTFLQVYRRFGRRTIRPLGVVRKSGFWRRPTNKSSNISETRRHSTKVTLH